MDSLRTTFQVSARHGCALIGLNRSTYNYSSRKDSQAALRLRIREIAETRVRYGYRRIHILLRREGWAVNAKRVYRLYALEDLKIRTKRPRRKVSARVRSDRKPPTTANDVWAMDFISDALFTGEPIRILTIVDAFTKVSPAIGVRRRYTGSDVVDTLDKAVLEYGLPKSIRVDNGPEFISMALDL